MKAIVVTRLFYKLHNQRKEKLKTFGIKEFEKDKVTYLLHVP